MIYTVYKGKTYSGSAGLRLTPSEDLLKQKAMLVKKVPEIQVDLKLTVFFLCKFDQNWMENKEAHLGLKTSKLLYGSSNFEYLIRFYDFIMPSLNMLNLNK